MNGPPRTNKSLVVLFVLALTLAALAAVFFVFASAPASFTAEEKTIYLSNRDISAVKKISIKNRFDEYTLTVEDGTITLGDLPAESVNQEYLFMLLDEAARIECLSPVEENVPLNADTGTVDIAGRYGFDPPHAEVRIDYDDGETLSFLAGDEEKISGGRYVLAGNSVMLISNSRAVRFVMPLSKFIHYEIVPFIKYQSPLRAVKKLTLSGSAFPRPIVIEEVNAESEEDMRTAASFGAAAHLVVSPGLHEADQKECIEVFASLTGLLNKDVFAYNADDGEFERLGFDSPLVRAAFIFRAGEDDPEENIILRAVKHEGDFLLVRDNQRVIHRIESSEAFLNTSYEKLAMRWFLTPFITDLDSLEVRLGKRTYRFTITGQNGKDGGPNSGRDSGPNSGLDFFLDGKKIDADRFRRFYSFLTSAAHDGTLLENPGGQGPADVPPAGVPLAGPPLAGVVFRYRDPLKAPDVMNLYEGTMRRLAVEVNGKTEFGMLRRYLPVLEEALSALEGGGEFSTAW